MTLLVERGLAKRLRRLLPVSWDNELDGRGEPTHAVLTFGEHETQAITMRPDDWMVLNEIPEALESLSSRIEEMRSVLRQFVHCAYPVATEINPRGHNWSEAYLDEALAEAKRILSQGEPRQEDDASV